MTNEMGGGGGEWKLGARTEFAKFLTYLLPFDDKSHCTCVTKCDNKAFHLSLAGAAACVPVLVARTSFILRPNFHGITTSCAWLFSRDTAMCSLLKADEHKNIRK